MRRVIDLLIIAMVIGLAAGAWWYRSRTTRVAESITCTQDSIFQISDQVVDHMSLEERARTGGGYPETIDPEWFGVLPQNHLLTGSRPWLEVAAAGEALLQHPAIRTASQSNLAAFWYNPASGIVRARVPAEISDQAALELYNDVNECYLTNLFRVE